MHPNNQPNKPDFHESMSMPIKKGLFTNPINDNDIDVQKTLRVDRIATKLEQHFNAPSSRDFYCKVALKLNEGKIDQLLKVVKQRNPRNPGGYFNVLARKEMFKKDVNNA